MAATIMLAKANLQGWVPNDSEVRVYITVNIRPPKGDRSVWGQKHTKKSGDIDNFIKAVLDAGNGVLWDDDCRVYHVEASKYYAQCPGQEGVVIICSRRNK